MIKTEKEPASLCLSGATQKKTETKLFLFFPPLTERDVCVATFENPKLLHTREIRRWGEREAHTHKKETNIPMC
jgi:hypothetical protein